MKTKTKILYTLESVFFYALKWGVEQRYKESIGSYLAHSAIFLFTRAAGGLLSSLGLDQLGVAQLFELVLRDQQEV